METSDPCHELLQTGFVDAFSVESRGIDRCGQFEQAGKNEI